MAVVKLIGNTPLYKLQTPTRGAEVWIKLEGGNPGGSIKDRAALGMLKMAEQNGSLEGKGVLIESTSGNMGIALALIGRALGFRVVLTMPESMSVERRTVLASFGAELVLTPSSEGMAGAGQAAERILSTTEGSIMLDQFSHPGNPAVHEETTGPEILRSLHGNKKLAAFVAGFGTGGTISGVGRALLENCPDVEVIAVEPAASPLITAGTTGSHQIQGIGANFIPRNLDRTIISRFIAVSDEDAVKTAKWLAREEGLFSGVSTGANVWAAMEIAKGLPEDSIVVTIQPDRGDKYLSVYMK